jgi:aminoglycoside phosphotransferase (APT) family kinase protein
MAAETVDDLPGLDLTALRAYLDRERPGLLGPDLSGELLAGGRSNLTYTVTDGSRTLVLRRPPLGHVLATAHDMGREYRAMSALADSAVPVPRTELLCTDTEVLGAPFYLMEKVDGVAMRSLPDAAWMSDDQARDVSFQLIDVLADLHAVDYSAVGLGDFGKPDGYLERQVRRWGKQLEASTSRELPGIEELGAWLGGRIPSSVRSTIVHGDYRIDNVLVAKESLKINAVLDWEMATLGDPLADLGVLQVYWNGAGDSDTADNPITGGLTRRSGFPTFAELVQRYAERSGADVDSLSWYAALGYYKLAIVLEGIYYRFSHGGTVGEGFDQIGALVRPLIDAGLAARSQKA